MLLITYDCAKSISGSYCALELKLNRRFRIESLPLPSGAHPSNLGTRSSPVTSIRANPRDDHVRAYYTEVKFFPARKLTYSFILFELHVGSKYAPLLKVPSSSIL